METSRWRGVVMVAGLLCASGVVAQEAAGGFPAQDEAAAVAWLDERLAQEKFDELLKATQPWMDQEKRPEVLWRYIRVLIDTYEVRNAPDAEKLRAYALAEKLARRCLALPDAKEHPHCHFYLGAALGRQGTVKGVLQSLGDAKEVEHIWLKGLQLARGKPQYVLDGAPLEAEFDYVLGIYYRLVPEWWMIQMLFGTRGDLQKSIAYQRAAVKLHPELARQIELAVSLLCRGDKEDDAAQTREGKALLQAVVAAPAPREVDRVDQRTAQKVLADPSLACGYSRDKPQNVTDQNAVAR